MTEQPANNTSLMTVVYTELSVDIPSGLNIILMDSADYTFM